MSKQITHPEIAVITYLAINDPGALGIKMGEDTKSQFLEAISAAVGNMLGVQFNGMNPPMANGEDWMSSFSPDIGTDLTSHPLAPFDPHGWEDEIITAGQTENWHIDGCELAVVNLFKQVQTIAARDAFLLDKQRCEKVSI